MRYSSYKSKEKERVIMRKQSVKVICEYSDEGDLWQIFFDAFRHFLLSKLANKGETGV